MLSEWLAPMHRESPEPRTLRCDPWNAAPTQVFIHDPLYNWALTAAAVRKRQRDDASLEEAGQGTPAPTPALARDRTPAAAAAVGNADAERTLLRVQAKLEGSESGTSCALQSGRHGAKRCACQLIISYAMRRVAAVVLVMCCFAHEGRHSDNVVCRHTRRGYCRRGRGSRRGGSGPAAAARCAGPRQPGPHVCWLGVLGVRPTAFAVQLRSAAAHMS